MRYPAIAELKYDGEFDFLYYDRTGVKGTYTINKYGTTRYSFPALTAIHETLALRKVDNAIILCEVYWDDGKAGKLYELNSNKTNDNIRIAMFDILSYNDTVIGDLELITRKEVLFDLFGKRWQPQYVVVTDKIEANEVFQASTVSGWEGIVVKNLDSPLTLGPCSWVKMKFKDQSDYKVILVDQTKERIEIEAPAVTSNSGGTTWISVGVKAPNRYKKHIKVGDVVTIEHQGQMKSGSLRHPVLIKKKEWV